MPGFAPSPPATRSPSARRLRRIWLAVLCASVAASVLLYAMVPASRPQLTEEDRFLEDATVAILALAAITGFWGVLRRRDVPRLTLLVPVAAFVALLDETSFGLAWLDVPPPEIRHIPIDAVHDLFLVAYDVFETDEPLYLACYALAALACATALIVGLRASPRFRAAVLRHTEPLRLPPFFYLGVAVAALALALVLDLDLVERGWLVFAEELAELEAAVALLFGRIAIRTTPRPR